jgi:hypothetical protein
MLTATTEVEAPLSVAAYLYITPRGVFQDGGRVACEGGRPKLAQFQHKSFSHPECIK